MKSWQNTGEFIEKSTKLAKLKIKSNFSVTTSKTAETTSFKGRKDRDINQNYTIVIWKRIKLKKFTASTKKKKRINPEQKSDVNVEKKRFQIENKEKASLLLPSSKALLLKCKFNIILMYLSLGIVLFKNGVSSISSLLQYKCKSGFLTIPIIILTAKKTCSSTLVVS